LSIYEDWDIETFNKLYNVEVVQDDYDWNEQQRKKLEQLNESC